MAVVYVYVYWVQHQTRMDERRGRISVVYVYVSFGSAPDLSGCERTTNGRRVRLRLLCSAPDLSGCQRATNSRRVRLCFIRFSTRPERM